MVIVLLAGLTVGGPLGLNRPAALAGGSPLWQLRSSCARGQPVDLGSPDEDPAADFSGAELESAYQSAVALSGRWIDLTALTWDDATSGWRRLADDEMPRIGKAFPYSPLTMQQVQYPTGIGTYPLSEITYALGGRYGAFRAQVGLDDTSTSSARVRFALYADDVLLFRSPLMSASRAPISVSAPLMGASQLRLVVEDPDADARGDYADWIAPQIFAPVDGAAVLAQAHARLVEVRAARARHVVQATSLRRPPVHRLGPNDRAPEIGNPGQSVVRFDGSTCMITVDNPNVSVAFGYGGPDHGRLFLSSPGADSPSLTGASSSIVLGDQRILVLTETQPDLAHPWDVAAVSDPSLGAGAGVTIHLVAPSGDPIEVLIDVYDDADYLTYQVRPGGALSPQGYSILTDDTSAHLGTRPRYLTDRGKIWSGRIPGDSLKREVPVEPSKPLLLWSDATNRGFVLATIDVTDQPMTVTVEREPDAEDVQLGLAMSFLPSELQAPGPHPSPRLWIEATATDNVYGSFAGYQAVMARMFPPHPLPPWVKYQWDSWWTYGPTPTGDGVERQVDVIARSLADLGPWHVLIDAAWYVAYGRPTADLRNVDYDKFPDGIRPVVDYAHDHGVNVVMYEPAGFVQSGLPEGGEWEAFQAIIDNHPDWLIPLFDDQSLSAYMLDYTVPAVRQYMRDVVTDAIDTYGADGIELDGLADPEGQITDARTRDLHEIRTPYFRVTDIYKLVADRMRELRPDTYLEGGWVNPIFAHPYGDTFFWADDWPAFNHAYPFGGMLQHIDYALFQWVALGQRAKMATVWGDPTAPDTRKWLEAALALGTQVSIGFDLTNLSLDQLSTLRTRLVHADPFNGITVASASAQPNAFATTNGHISFVGLVNRTSQAKSLDDEVGQLNVIAPGLMAYDVDRDRWIAATDLPGFRLDPMSFRLFLIPHQPRIVWSNASWTYEPSDDSSLVATLSGPAEMQGFAQVWAPGTTSVTLDGIPLARGASSGPRRYAYDVQTGVVSLSFDFAQAHRLEIHWQ